MKKISKKTYFLIATLSAICAMPISKACANSVAGVKAEVKNVDIKIHEDLAEALNLAKKDGKYVLLEISGADWCPPCQMMRKFVLKTREFIKYAGEKLHVVVADFDRYGEPKNKKFSAKHKAILEKFDIRGFPTLIIIAPDGTVVDTIVGLQVRSPQDLISRIDASTKSKK